jgi:hypothetical protein
MPINTEIKKFFKSFVVILTCIFIADFVIGNALEYLYKKQSSGLLYRTSYAINNTNASYLVFGSSRANHHYAPQVFEKELNDSFYNCGRDAQGSVYSCAVASAVIERYKPKCVILDVRGDEFTNSDEGQLSALFPYKHNKAISKYFAYNSPYEKAKLVSQIYPYNSLLTNLLVGVTAFNKKRTEDYKGYMALYTNKASTKFKLLKETQPIDTAKVRYFKELLAKLDKAEIPALVVISPMHYNYVDGPTVKLLTAMCARYNKSIKFLNYAHKPICKEAKYFNDDYHLNNTGAYMFSQALVEPIKSILNSSQQ